MIEIAGERGYDAVTVRELTRLSGVSTRAFYQHFGGGKEECLLRTYELVTEEVADRIAASQSSGSDWRQRLKRALWAFTDELIREPQAARLVLIEAFAAGPAALERMQRAEARFEAVLSEVFSDCTEGKTMPPLLLQGIVAGVAHVARAQMLFDRGEAVADLADELVDWASTYCGETAASLEEGGCRSVPMNDSIHPATIDRPEEISTDDRALILSAAAKLAVADGYEELSVSRIRTAAGISRRRFHTHFKGVEDCFLALLELRIGNVVADAAAARTGAGAWPEGIHRAISALCSDIARDPALARLGFIDVFGPGLDGMQSRERLITTVAKLFRESAPTEQRPTELIAKASVGAIWGVLYQQVASGRAQQLPRIVPTLSFLALAPIIGPKTAASAIRREQSP